MQQDMKTNKETTSVEFPEIYFQSIYRSLNSIIDSGKNNLQIYKSRSVNVFWNMYVSSRNNSEKKQSERAHFWLWNIILLAVNNEDDDFILTIWKRAHSFYTFSLKQIDIEYDNKTFDVTNKVEIESRDSERNEFKSLIYALGGLLLYRKRYNALSRILNYTTSDPPIFELFPSTLAEVYKWYMEFQDPHERKYSWISHQYSFPDMEGLKADHQIKYWIKMFIAVLFIRQYTIQQFYTYQNPLKNPKSPDKQIDKRLLKENLRFLVKLTNEVLENQRLMHSLNWSYIDNSWFEKENKPTPKKIIDEYLDEIKFESTIKEKRQILSKEKVSVFELKTKDIVSTEIDKLRSFFTSEIKQNYKSWFFNGLNAVISKTAFVDDQDAAYMNYESFLAEGFVANLRQTFPFPFSQMKTSSYLLKLDEIFSAIAKIINLNKIDEYKIICFGINDHYLKNKGVIISNNKFNGIDILNLRGYFNPLTEQSVVLVKSEFLPALVFNDLSKDVKRKYHYKEPMVSTTKLYATVINLFQEKELIEELKPQYPDKALEKHVLMNIFLNMELRFKNDTKMTLFKVFDEYNEKGIKDKISDVVIDE